MIDPLLAVTSPTYVKVLKAVAPFLLAGLLLFTNSSPGQKYFTDRTTKDLRALHVHENAIVPAADVMWTKAQESAAWASTLARLLITLLGFYLVLPQSASGWWIVGIVVLALLTLWPGLLERLLPPGKTRRLWGKDRNVAKIVNGLLILAGTGVAVGVNV